VMLRGVELGGGQLYLDRLMALDGSGQAPTIAGIAAKEPAFGLPSVWIAPSQRPDAEARGLTLVDPASVITTHLSELVRRHAHELMGRQEVQELLNLTAKQAPKLVESTVPAMLTLTELVAVTRGLLREGISVRDLRTVLEAVADAAVKSKDPGHLLESARRRLSRTITARVADEKKIVHALSLARRTEDVLRSTLVHQDGEAALAPDVDTARRVVSQLERHASVMAGDGHLTVVLAPPDLRRPLFDLLTRFVPDVSVINARELATGAQLRVVGTLDVDLAA
jgi:flagellar biosynthesis protein FlhA